MKTRSMSSMPLTNHSPWCSKDISRDRQVEDVHLCVDGDVMDNALAWLILPYLRCTHGEDLNLQVNMETSRHLTGPTMKMVMSQNMKHILKLQLVAGDLQVLGCRGLGDLKQEAAVSRGT